MDWEILSKGFLKSLAEYGDIQATQAKLKTDIMANDFKAKNNFIWKMAEQRAEWQNKVKMFQEAKNQGLLEETAPSEGNLGQPVFGMSSQPKMTLGTSGPEISTPAITNRDWIRRLQWKQEQGQARKGDPFAYFSETEKSWWNKAMGEGGKITYSEQKRTDIQASAERIKAGQSNWQAEKKNLMTKYPDMGWNTIQNLRDLEKMYKPDIIKANREFRNTAIQELKKAGYPITENNIKAAIEQLGR